MYNDLGHPKLSRKCGGVLTPCSTETREVVIGGTETSLLSEGTNRSSHRSVR